MAVCYYRYSFDLEDGIIHEEILDDKGASPTHIRRLKFPLDFDDFIDDWKAVCHPVFEHAEDAEKLTLKYFQTAYAKGELAFSIDLEHNPLRSTHATKYTRIKILLFEDEETKRPRATVMWEDNPELGQEQKKNKGR